MHYGMLVVHLGSTTDSANIVLTHTTWLMETPVQISVSIPRRVFLFPGIREWQFSFPGARE